MVKRQIIIKESSPPELVGNWTIGEVLAAARFLQQWIESQGISQEQPPAQEKGHDK